MTVSASSRKWAMIAFRYLCGALGTGLFGFVYEQFSHDVWSVPMIYAFAIPLIGGALPFSVLALFGGREPGRFARTCWSLGMTTLTVGSLFAGVLEIYGTTNRLIVAYPVAGGLLCAAALGHFCLAKSSGS